MFHKFIYILGLITFIYLSLCVFLIVARGIGIRLGVIDKCEY